ncbi:uncharacterized protein JCM10292_001326 [Rhodotorula paludigena]|uniref:uncharacterized protein n=1 Tax=Rhodotorula paludigena TaxID=86838 RepID=UPI003173E7FF
MDSDELHRRLCLAVEQQDVLYTLVWLRELEQTGDLKEDDDDGLSALLRRSGLPRSLVDLERLLTDSPFASLILSVLALRLTLGTRFRAAERANTAWATTLLRSSESSQDAQHLLELDLHSAADWIDRSLPPHPAPDTLTGFGPLPSAACGHGQTEPAASTPPESSEMSAAEAVPSIADGPSNNRSPSRASAGSSRVTSTNVPIQPSRQLLQQRRPVQIHLGELPLDTSLEEVNRLFREAGVKPCQTFLRRRANKYSAYCHVQHASDYRHASTALHGRVLRGQRLLIERNPPPVESASDPIVCVRGLPPHMDDSSMRWIARATRCGAWGERIEQRSPAPDARTASGVFRVPSPVSAQEAVNYLDGMTLLGTEVLADWRFGDEDEGMRRRSAQYERGREIQEVRNSFAIRA